MRGWVIVILFAAVLAGGGWFAMSAGVDRVDLAPAAGDPEAAAGDPTDPADPLRSPVGGATGGEPDSTATPRATAVTIAATGPDGEAVRGFAFTVTGARDAAVLQVASAASGHVLRLAPGVYTLAATHPALAPPEPQRFTVPAGGPPVALQLPFAASGAVLSLEVLDQSTAERIRDFRVTIDSHAGGGTPQTRFVTQPADNPLPIHAARGQRLVVRVEAQGYAPAEPVAVEFGAAQEVRKRVFLAAAMRFTGVEFQVHDDGNAPVPHLLVETWIEREGTLQPLWRRRKSEPQGVYRLPDLAPGRYRFRLHAVDGAGHPTLHLPHEYRCTLTGNEHLREVVALHAGAQLELRLTDAAGRRIGKGIKIELTHPDGTARESIWQPLADGKPDPKAAHSADHLAADRPARLATCVPGGTYTIKLQWHRGPVVVRTVHLTAGRIENLEAALSRE